jgi:hypothetical protein
MRVNSRMHHLAARRLYETVRLDGAAIPSFFYGSNVPWKRGSTRRASSSLSPSSSKPSRLLKPDLLARTRVLTLESHSADLCSENAPGAALLSSLHTLRIVVDMGKDRPSLCAHPHCEFLHVLEPKKLVVRNCNGRTALPFDLRWSLPDSVDTAVIVLPLAPNDYYDSGGGFYQYLLGIAGTFRLVPRIKIIFWGQHEGVQSRQGRAQCILVEDLIVLLQHLICTNHKPGPEVTVYGLEMLNLKSAGTPPMLAGIYSPTPSTPHDIVRHALSTLHHAKISSPRTGLRAPFLIPYDILWENMTAYEASRDREAEITDTA